MIFTFIYFLENESYRKAGHLLLILIFLLLIFNNLVVCKTIREILCLMLQL